VFDGSACEVIAAAREPPPHQQQLRRSAHPHPPRLACGRHTRASPPAPPAAHAAPIRGLAPLPIGRLDVDDAATADESVAPTLLLAEAVALRVGEAALGRLAARRPGPGAGP
jgi:hypothetical protein